MSRQGGRMNGDGVGSGNEGNRERERERVRVRVVRQLLSSSSVVHGGSGGGHRLPERFSSAIVGPDPPPHFPHIPPQNYLSVSAGFPTPATRIIISSSFAFGNNNNNNNNNQGGDQIIVPTTTSAPNSAISAGGQGDAGGSMSGGGGVRRTPIKRSTPEEDDYGRRREFETGESSNAGAVGGANNNNNAQPACTCVTCPLHGGTPGHHQLHPAHGGGGGNMWSSAEVQRALQSSGRDMMMFLHNGNAGGFMGMNRDNMMMSASPSSPGRITVTIPPTTAVSAAANFPPLPLPLGSYSSSSPFTTTIPRGARRPRPLSNAARAWIQRLSIHEEYLMRSYPPSHPSNNQAFPILPRNPPPPPPVPFPPLVSDVNTLRLEIRTSLQHLLNGGSIPIEELLILDYSIMLNLLESVGQEDRVPHIPVAPYDDEVLLFNMEDDDDDEEIEDINEIGLSEREILTFLPREIFSSNDEGNQNDDLCSICQEDYVDGEEIGRLDCNHIYHYNCIKQWLVHKNLCPICKRTALAAVFDDDDDDDDEDDNDDGDGDVDGDN